MTKEEQLFLTSTYQLGHHYSVSTSQAKTRFSVLYSHCLSTVPVLFFLHAIPPAREDSSTEKNVALLGTKWEISFPSWLLLLCWFHPVLGQRIFFPSVPTHIIFSDLEMWALKTPYLTEYMLLSPGSCPCPLIVAVKHTMVGKGTSTVKTYLNTKLALFIYDVTWIICSFPDKPCAVCLSFQLPFCYHLPG